MLVAVTVSLFSLWAQQAESAAAADWPVFFEHLGNVNSIHNKWELTFRIETNFGELGRVLETLAQQIDRQSESFTRSTGSEEEDDGAADGAKAGETVQSAVKNHWENSAALLHRKVEVLKRKLSDLSFLGQSATNRKPSKPYNQQKSKQGKEKKDPRLVEKTSHESSDFSPPSPMATPRKRVKRQDGGPGGLLQLLFGLAYTDNINAVQEKVNNIERKLQSDLESLLNAHVDSNSNLDRRIGDTQAMVKKVENMTMNLEEAVVGMARKKGLKGGSLLAAAASELTDVEDILLTIQQLDIELELADWFLAEVEAILAALAGGRLPAVLVPALQLRRQLVAIETALPAGFSLLYPSDESLWPYYSVIPTSIYFSPDAGELVVRLSVPLVDEASGLDLYRVHNLPLKMRDGYSVTADIETEYLLVARGGLYHLELSKEDFQDCHSYQAATSQQVFFCGFKPLLHSRKHETCVIQLFNLVGDGDGEADEGALCQSRVTHGLVQPFARLYNGSWVFSALDGNIPVTLQCPGNKSIPTSLFGFGVITLLEGCSLSSEEFFYPPIFAAYTDVSLALDPHFQNETSRPAPPAPSGQKPNFDMHVAVDPHVGPMTSSPLFATSPSSPKVTTSPVDDDDNAIFDSFKTTNNIEASGDTSTEEAAVTLEEGGTLDSTEDDTLVTGEEVGGDETAQLQKTVMKIITIKDFVT